MTVEQRQVTAVAVIGMACRLPGGIDSPETLWDALLRGDDLVTEVPADRWDAEDYYDPEPGAPGRSVSRWGGFLNDVAGFDPEFFGISEREATAIDPQHRLLMQTSWEAVEHAGVPPESLADSLTGVFAGMCHDDYAHVTDAAGALGDAYGFTGTAFSMASGRVSYALGLRGPSITVDTACSSSLVAVHLACRSLHERESDLALAGGCMVMLEPQMFASASGQGMLSATGRCRSFDAAADGFVRSEACAVLLLKRLPDALRDGDRVLAVVRGTAVNQDGRTDTITSPSGRAQVLAYRSALAAAGVDPDTVGMIETHGTGTPVGDPIEFLSLAEVYGANGNACALASAKSNLGHTEAAAGVVGMVKAILSLRHGVIPPMAHFTGLPPELAAVETGLFVPRRITPWPGGWESLPRRAAVSSYGMSGTNAHAILEQAPDTAAPAEGERESLPRFFALSASSPEALRQTARRLANWVDEERPHFRDLAYTLASRRGRRPVRRTLIAGDNHELVRALRGLAAGDGPLEQAVGLDDRGPVWVFSGQGSQWAAMGADLLATEPAFAATVAAAEPLIAAESGFSVTDALTAAETVTGIDRVQPTLFVMQVALAEAMRARGVRPGAVIGHSLGEVSAAVVAGALSLQDGLRVICRRSRLCLRLAGAGAMAAVELPTAQVREELTRRAVKDVVIAVVASPQSTVIGGATETVRQLVAAWEEREVLAREVAVDVASHTPQVNPILDELAGLLTELTPLPPRLPYYSATLFDPRERPLCDARYWVDNLRHTVRFSAAAKAALQDGFRVFAELSPHPLLTRAIEQTAAGLDMPVAAVAAMRRGQRDPHGLLGLVADLHDAGAAVDFAQLNQPGQLVDAPLPAWANRPLLLRAKRADVSANPAAAQSLLGVHVRLMEEPERHAWQADVGTSALPWLADHRINDVAALPAAVYCAMALAAAETVLGEGAEVRDISFEEMLLLDAETAVGAVATVHQTGEAGFAVHTDSGGQKVRRAAAVLHSTAQPQPATHDIDALLAAHPRRLDGDGLRDWFEGRGVRFGPAFTGLLAARVADGAVSTVLAEVSAPGAIRRQHTGSVVHPAVLDACFQSVAAHPAMRAAGNGGLVLPLRVRLLRAHGVSGRRPRAPRYCYTTVTACGSNVEADIDVTDEHGTVLLEIRGLLMGTGCPAGVERDRLLGERLLGVEWQQRELPPPTANPGKWLVISTFGSVASDLADALASAGAECATMAWPHEDAALRTTLASGGFSSVLVVGGTAGPDPQDIGFVRELVRIARELLDVPGEAPRLYVLTNNAQVALPDDPVNLAHAGIRGLLRAIGAEHPYLRPTHIDVDALTGPDKVARQLLAATSEDETAWRHDRWLTARLCPAPLRPDERVRTVVNHHRDGMRLHVRTPGDPETIECLKAARIRPGPGQIEVAVRASSVNFADVLAAFGRYPSFDGQQPQLGLDFAGVVTAVGPDVAHLQVGERVGGMSLGGCWASYLTCDAALAAPLPTGLSWGDAAAITTASATAWYGLHDLARIKAGDKVLIHSATGGVGQAAIAIARASDAQIFATAGTPHRRKMLRDMGINHVYNSRSTEFAEQIRRDTDGYGVDIVLNSLTGPAQRAGLDLLAFGGQFVEIGKRDIYGDTRLGLFAFRRNLSLHAVDLALLAATHPHRVRATLNEVYRRTADQSLPKPQRTHYPVSHAAKVIRMMSAAQHTGKLILDMPSTAPTVIVPPEQVPVVRADGSYLITGGLGGLGLFLAEQMAAAGAGRIVLNSRTTPSRKVMETIELVRATGADVVVECGDIAAPDTAENLVALAVATGLPLRGVLHAAAVVEDATLPNISDELLERDWAPKVHGAWHLHRATATAPLDWFCVFSSAAALLGSPGQCAYAAANSWLDGFTHWRRAQGRPATAIAWGAWAEIGRGAGLATGDTTMIAPEEGAHAFTTLLRHTRCFSGYTPATGSPWLAALAERSPFAERFAAVASNGRRRNEQNRFRAGLFELPVDEWPSRLRRLVSEQVGMILRRGVDPDRPLSDHGLDSLGNLELRTRIEAETGIRLSSTDITTVRELADHMCAKFQPAPDAPVSM
ncbi:sulfolipid-1 biosynthesis phthioceranic/hydroxyphthioceranic acid synthase [Mycobacterium sp.]|uniref:sulfolipid-1 biosynthesis phthioceranic/hydroxyphthioceranic acid synthase n=1 Tax=Mycobacterium sp. TaxID=1785 RepID=UPI000CAF80AA|nr:sulfolipid-1 biosynthesis phthioceranic/hydroxyphthioceranic acid synthase [Mycobacterium sp.]PJE06461.1 MAG: polyketide synthase [Mycobacterium sp.]